MAAPWRSRRCSSTRVEDLAEAQPGRGLDVFVELDEGAAEAFREQRADRALAGAAQSEQRNVAARQRAVTGEQRRRRNVERFGELDEPQHRRVRVATLDVGEEAFADAGLRGEVAPTPAARLAQRAHRPGEPHEERMRRTRGAR